MGPINDKPSPELNMFQVELFECNSEHYWLWPSSPHLHSWHVWAWHIILQMDIGTPRVQPNESDHRDLFLLKHQYSNCNQKLLQRIYPNVELNHWPIDQRHRHTFSQIGNLVKWLIWYRIPDNEGLRDNSVIQWHWHNKVEAIHGNFLLSKKLWKFEKVKIFCILKSILFQKIHIP